MALTESNAGFDPAALDDPLALRTDWSPLEPGGASFRTHKLVRIGPGRVEFQATGLARFMYFAFLGSGLLVVVLTLLGVGELAQKPILSTLVGLLFTVVGAGMVYFGTAPVVFDKVRGRFWRGRQTSFALAEKLSPARSVLLSEVHALQLVAEYCRGKHSFYSHELNLVLDDGQRVNVVDHGASDKVRTDAHLLSTFLRVPVWDATD